MDELLGDSCWPAYGLSYTDDAVQAPYTIPLSFKVHIKQPKETSKAVPLCSPTSENG